MRRAVLMMTAMTLRAAAAALPLAAWCATAPPALAQSGASGPVRVTAEVASDRVYVGQPFTLQISVEGDTRSQPPEVPDSLDGFRVEAGGSSTSSEIVFDGTRTVERSRRIFQYSLTATRVGELTIPPVEVRTRDGVKRTEPIRIAVAKPGELENFKLRLETNVSEAYVGQPVTLRLTWFIGSEVRQAAFSMPSLPDGFHLYSPADDGLTPAHFQSGQFYEVNFLGERSVARAGRGELGGRQFNTLTIEKVIVPGEPGEYDLGPATVAFTQSSRVRRSIFDSPLFDPTPAQTEVVASQPLTLSVRPLPAEGRPASFSGLVGSYSVEAKADPREARVGDPITLTVTVKGDGPAEEIPTLDLTGQAGFESAFKLTGERPTVEGVQGGKRFTTMIRAREPGDIAVPPIELTYFDPDAGEYRTAESRAIPLRIEAAPRVQLPGVITNDDGAPAADERATGATAQAPSSRGPREVTLDDLAPAGRTLLDMARGPLGVVALATPPVAALALVAVGAARRRSTRDPAKKRRSRALREATRALERDKGEAGVLSAVRVFAADWSGRSREAMTPEEAAAWLEERAGVGAAAPVARAVEACAASRYGGGSAGDVDAARRSVREALPAIDSALRARKENA